MNIKHILSKIKRMRMRRFAQKYDIDKLAEKLAKRKAKVMLIDKGYYEYGYFNFAFLNNMVSLIIDAICKGYYPVIHLDKRKEGWTNWDTFFEQPFGVSLPSKYKTSKKKGGIIIPNFKTPYNIKDLAVWSKVYNDFVVLNAQTEQYVKNEYETLLKGKRVLGVLCRGTDYTQKRPYGHPVQPEIEDVISEARTKMTELQLDYIYLATEEYRINKQFEAAFPQKIIINKRYYYDDVFYKNKFTDIYQIHGNHESEIYERSLEYLSSIWLLSRCDALIAGNNGGSTAALYLNNGKYKYWKLFDLGFYGIDDKK